MNKQNIKYNLKIDTVYFFLLIFVFFPIFSVDKIDPLGFDTLPEYSYSKLIRIVWVMLTLITCMIIISKHGRYHYEVGMNLYDTLILIYLLSATISIAVNTPTRLVAWYRLFELIVFYFSSLLVTRYAFMQYNYHGAYNFLCKGIFYSFLATIIVLTVLGLYNTNYAFLSEIQNRVRLGGYCYSPNTLSILFVITQICAAYFFITHKYDFISFSFITLILHIAVFMTGSRTGLAILFFSDLILSFKLKSFSRLTKYFIILFLFALLTTVFIIIVYSSNLDLFVRLIGLGEDPLSELITLNNRASIYLVAFEGILQKPVIGHGYVDGVRQYLANNYSLSFWLPPHTHNSFIEVLLAQGFIGGLPLIFIIIYSLALAIKSIIHSKLTQNIIGSVIILSIFLSSLTTVPLGNTIINIGNIFVVFSYSQYLHYRYKRNCA